MNFLNAFYAMTITKNGSVFDRDSFPIFFNSISRVFISERTGEIGQIEFTLTPNFDDAIVILTSGLLGISVGTKDQLPKTKGGRVSASPTTGGKVTGSPATDSSLLSNQMSGFAQVEVSLLRPNEGESVRTHTFKGALTMPDVQISGANITITVKGYANAVFSIAPDFVFDIKKLGGTVKTVIDAAAKLMNYTITEKKGHEALVKAAYEQALDLTPKTCTPFALIKWALSQVKCGFNESYNDNNTLELMVYSNTISMFNKIDPEVTFVMWRQIDLANKVYPLLDYNLESKNALFITGRAFGTYKLGADEKSKSYISNDILKKDSDVENKKSSLQEIIEKSEMYPGVQYMNPNQTSEVSSKQADASLVIGNANYQKYSLTVQGNPFVKMLDQVKIMIGDIQELAGIVLITKVEHVLDESGWITNLEGTQIGSLDQELQQKAPSL